MTEIEFTSHQRYFYIAVQNYLEVAKLINKERELEKSIRNKANRRDDAKYNLTKSKIWNDKLDHTLVTIIFSALSLEAYINDYAIRMFSKRYFEKYLDKLSILSKWIVIPRLVNGAQLDPSSKPMEELDWLIRKRHELVHYKTRKVERDKLQASDFLWPAEAERAINTVISVVLALNEIDKQASADWLTTNEPYSLIKDM